MQFFVNLTIVLLYKKYKIVSSIIIVLALIMIGVFMVFFRLALLVMICSNATAVAMITIGDNGLKEATYHHLSPKGYRDIRLVCQSWAQYNNEPKRLYDLYSKDGKISSTCAFLVCVHKNRIFDVEVFLRHTNILAHLNECYRSKYVTLSPFTIACHNKNKEMLSLLN